MATSEIVEIIDNEINVTNVLDSVENIEVRPSRKANSRKRKGDIRSSILNIKKQKAVLDKQVGSLFILTYFILMN